MTEVEQLVKTTLGEIERILSTKTVVGDPIMVEGNTIIPLIAIGFGFGGGGGTGGGKDKGEGTGAGTGGGGGVKPIGVIVVSGDGVKVEPIRGSLAGLAEAVAEGISTIMDKRAAKKEKPSE